MISGKKFLALPKNPNMAFKKVMIQMATGQTYCPKTKNMKYTQCVCPPTRIELMHQIKKLADENKTQLLIAEAAQGRIREIESEYAMLKMRAVTAESEVFYAGKSIGIDGVRSVVSVMLSGDAEMPVVIQGDKNAKHGVVMKVTDAAKQAGAKRVFSATAK